MIAILILLPPRPTLVMSERETRNKQLGTAVTPTEKRAFEKFCKDRGRTPSEMLRLMLAKVCPGDIDPGAVGRDEASGYAVYVRLRKSEANALREKTKAEGTTGPSWVRRIIRAKLFGVYHFTRAEEAALRESNRELAHLGRNINQIAHNMNISLNALDQMNAERMQEIARQIEAHRKQVSSLLKASWGRVADDENEGGA